MSKKLFANQFAEVTGYPLKAVKQLCKSGIVSYLPVGNKYLIDYETALAEIRTYQESMKKEKQVIMEPQKALSIERTDDFSSSLKNLMRKGA